MAYAVGSLVRARGREWVVLPGSAEDLLLIRPLGGTDEEVTGPPATEAPFALEMVDSRPQPGLFDPE